MSFEGVIGIVQCVMNLAGILAFALSGAFLGVRKDFDVLGVVMLAEAVGLGGGVIRDLVIGVRPVAFSAPGYFCAPIVGGLVVFHSARPQRHERAFDLFRHRRRWRAHQQRPRHGDPAVAANQPGSVRAPRPAAQRAHPQVPFLAQPVRRHARRP